MQLIDWLVVLALFLIATAVGGAVARVAFLFSDVQSLVVMLLIFVLLVVVGAIAAKSGRWLASPYW